MSIYFVDSSALVTRYISEAGSTWILELFDAKMNNEVFVAAITSVEIIAAIARRTRNRSISASDSAMVCKQFRNDLLTDYQIVEIGESIISSGMTLAETREFLIVSALLLPIDGCKRLRFSLDR
jgi:uncharacterized protein